MIAPGSAGYGAASLVYNERYDAVRPLAIVRVQDVKDVQAVVRLGAAHRRPDRAALGRAQLRRLVDRNGRRRRPRQAAGDPSRGRDGGDRSGEEADRRLLPHSPARALTIPAGSCASVALGGLALGGGIGLASRKLGTTSDNVESLRIVTADGRLLTCDAKHNADLFWACRGGGGRNFGIVTDFRLRASPVSTGAYFFATWPWSAGPTIMPAWQRWAPNAPDELMTLVPSLDRGDRADAPDLRPVPRPREATSPGCSRR